MDFIKSWIMFCSYYVSIFSIHILFIYIEPQIKARFQLATFNNPKIHFTIIKIETAHSSEVKMPSPPPHE